VTAPAAPGRAPGEPLFPQPLLDALAGRPDETAIEHGPRTISCRELLSLTGTLVDGLRAEGLGPGRGVALHTAITPEAFAANLAAHALGCRVVGIRPGWEAPQLAAVLDDVDAVVGDPSTLTTATGGLSDRAAVLCLGEHRSAVDLLGGQPLGQASDGTEPIVVEARPDDIARLNFTSGSTGRPKGCARTYRTFSLAYRSDRWAPDLARLVARCERFLVYNSLSIPVMVTFAGRCLMTGGTVVMPGEDPRPDLAGAIDRYGVTGVAMIVPSLHRMLDQLRARPRRLRRLRALIVTGSPAGPRLLADAMDMLGPVVWQGYGQAESGMISLLTPDELARRPAAATASVGRPLPDVEVSVRDPAGRPVALGEIGEVCVRSPHVMASYWRDPRGTNEVLRDGWLHTRDLGHLDAHGLLRLTGRSRDVVIVNGEVCYAGAIERLLCRDRAVSQAYVVGVPDAGSGEAIHAFVVPVADRRPDVRALAGLVRSELTANHVPAAITVTGDIPVSASGKPDKRALAERAARPPSPGVGRVEQVEQAVERGGGAVDVPGREQVEHRAP
jgi:fatty-acyl-CoA synthase